RHLVRMLCCDWCREPVSRKVTLVVVGLDNAGKTTIVRDLQGDLGFILSDLAQVTLYDLSHGLVFVVGSSDVKRNQDTRVAITDVLHRDLICVLSLSLSLSLSNKQDLSGALGEVELIHRLSLEKLVNRHQCRCLIVSLCLAQGRPIREGVEWLLDYISHDYKALNERHAWRKRRGEKRRRGER
uniref:Uncharacterized protein n=1 Tax=Hucho hucho TaxID=62062 RepID=A0A4W5MY13_9TELE